MNKSWEIIPENDFLKELTELSKQSLKEIDDVLNLINDFERDTKKLRKENIINFLLL